MNYKELVNHVLDLPSKERSYEIAVQENRNYKKGEPLNKKHARWHVEDVAIDTDGALVLLIG
jgi:hypothetical protein